MKLIGKEIRHDNIIKTSGAIDNNTRYEVWYQVQNQLRYQVHIHILGNVCEQIGKNNVHNG